MKRFRRIETEFGTGALVRTLVLLISLPALSLFDYLGFSSIRAGVIAIAGLALGWLLRHVIADGVEYYHGILRVGLIVYSIVLLVGGFLGLSGSAQLAVITATTVIIFDLQFWSLSDPSVVNSE
ncbi:MAG TPA: hypothetical protein VJM12_14235 [Pyrinomonadaceae bacterium]|nr:hypothetical protein [Pyrinomonadaceae bacterium]